MADLLQIKVKALKERINNLKNEIQRLEKENSAGLLSPLERMRISPLQQEKDELAVKLRELLM